MKLLTIGIPTYNRRKYLQESLERLLPQIKKNRDDIELFISDNCSSDGTADFLKQISEKNPEVNYQVQPENCGAERNFISIFGCATGKYVWILSDDDIVMENGIDHIISFLKNHEELDCLHINNFFFKKDFSPENLSKPRLKNESDCILTNKEDVMKIVGCNLTLITTSVFKTEKVRKIKNIEQYIPTLFVQGYVFLISTKAPDARVGYIGKPLVAVRGNGAVSYNMYHIFGESLWTMMNYAVQECGYPFGAVYKAYYDYWWKVVLKGVIGAKANGYKNMYEGFERFFKITWKHPRAWLGLYPILLIPAPVYVEAKKLYRSIKAR